jgi:hypothetical protein
MKLFAQDRHFRNPKQRLAIAVAVLFCFLPFQNCGENFQFKTSSLQSSSPCEGESCESDLGESTPTPEPTPAPTLSPMPEPLPNPTPTLSPTPTPPPTSTSRCDSYSHDRKITISTVADLRALPARAVPGDLFILAAGTYLLDSVVFENIKGTSSKMITLCGEVSARIIGPGARSQKRILTIRNSQYFRMAHLDFSLGMKGLMAEGTSYSRFENLTIHDVGHEALHLMLWSHHNVIKNSRFYNTGQEPGAEGLGEGVYIGTSLTKNIEDASDYNQILNNQFGPGITAEHIDIKEYSSHGLIEGNQFDGRGISQVNSAESWVNIKGNHYLIKNNSGRNTPVRGFKQIVRAPGQGNFNTFENN